jgi:hypothetical protein
MLLMFATVSLVIETVDFEKNWRLPFVALSLIGTSGTI